MKKSVKTYFLGAILGVLGSIAIGAISALVLPNWESHAEIDLFFPKNTSAKISSYYEVRSDSLKVYQTEGDSECRYTIKCMPRGGSYNKIKEGLQFSENNESNGEEYPLKSYWWRDIRFKVEKTKNQSVKSGINLSLGKSTD